ncbi:gliding motility protein GldM [Sanyastnella coralliicola]|uniref:type IX secretion system motor protein PorM/GldM n=1 Tax=Sanyastnella coralliicola TaxID=3069118 RepID=UPI0027B95F03|nr:gliding motility protein GldM [Longitalea sp. SCSIO 12813]
MAGNNMSPRQKMIGMMYLVLTAMLALNVQREVLEAFVTLDEGIERAGEQQELENDRLMSEIQAAYSLDPTGVRQWMEAADQVRQGASLVQTKIDSLRVKLVMEAEGLERSEADTLQLRYVEKQDDIDVATYIMVGEQEDGSGGEAAKLREQILSYTGGVNDLLFQRGLEAIDLPVDFSSRMVDDIELEWEVHAFYEMPFVASITMMSKLQNDIRRFESEALNRLAGELDADDFPIDTVLARVLPKSSYVLQGETYEADIFLGGFSTTLAPEILIGELDENGQLINEGQALEVNNGMGHFAVDTRSEGIQSYSGVVRMPNKRGQVMEFPFESEYMVARPSATVSPTAMNVLYKGVENPLSVSVPGVPKEKTRVRITGNGNRVSPKGDAYEVVLNNSARGTVSVIVEAEIDGGYKEMGKQEFRVKPLPKPSARFGDVANSGVMTKAAFKVNYVIGEYGDDFVFNLPLRVTSFTLAYPKDGVRVEKPIPGRQIPRDLWDLIDRIPRNTIVTIEDIIVKGNDGVEHEVSPIIIKITG